jgi:BNR repeat-like domain
MRFWAALAVTLAAAALAPAVAARTVRIDGPRGSVLSEPELAVDPADPRRVLVVAKDGGVVLDAFHSANGGATFAGGPLVAGSYLGARAFATDPVVVIDGDGTTFFGQLVRRDLPGQQSESIVGVMRSDDRGATYATPVPVARAPFREVGDTFGPFDKEWLAVDRGGGPRDGTLYAAWVRLDLRRGRRNTILVSRSGDGGATWSPPLRISSLRRYAVGPQVVVEPDGDVHVAWASFRRGENDRRGVVLHAVSRDGGASFSGPRRVAGFRNGFAAYKLVALAASGGGRLLACWSQGGDRSSRTSCSRSPGGASWSRPVSVAPRVPGAHDLVAVAGQDGNRFWVTFYARRSRGTSVLLYRSDDGGRRYRLARVLARRPYRLNAFVGDYTGLEAVGGRLFGAYVLPRSGPRSQNSIYAWSLPAP